MKRITLVLAIFTLINGFSFAQETENGIPHKTTSQPETEKYKPRRGDNIGFYMEFTPAYAVSFHKRSDDKIISNDYTFFASLHFGLQLYQRKEKPFFLRVSLLQIGWQYGSETDLTPIIGLPGVGFGRHYQLSDNFAFEPSLTANVFFYMEDFVDPVYFRPIVMGKAKFLFNRFALDFNLSYLPYAEKMTAYTDHYHNVYFGISVGFLAGRKNLSHFGDYGK